MFLLLLCLICLLGVLVSPRLEHFLAITFLTMFQMHVLRNPFLFSVRIEAQVFNCVASFQCTNFAFVCTSCSSMFWLSCSLDQSAQLIDCTTPLYTTISWQFQMTLFILRHYSPLILIYLAVVEGLELGLPRLSDFESTEYTRHNNRGRNSYDNKHVALIGEGSKSIGSAMTPQVALHHSSKSNRRFRVLHLSSHRRPKASRPGCCSL